MISLSLPVQPAFYSSSYNTHDFSREMCAQSETCLHREYNLTMKNKSLSCTVLHRSIVTHAQARRIALRAQWKALTRRARCGKNAEAFLNAE